MRTTFYNFDYKLYLSSRFFYFFTFFIKILNLITSYCEVIAYML